ncbi:MAG TPA: biotin/lipoyl-containing protein [Thermoanaerobaculia bacterium]|jgi:biotin carboxyl carrier protein
MKFQVRMPGQSEGRTVVVTAGAPAFEATLENAVLTGDALEVRDGVWSLVGLDGRQIEVSVAFQKDGSVRASAAGALFGFELLDELTARALLTTGGRAAKKVRHLTAAMPGRVLRVLVAAGDRVTQGQPVLVLEAMKMENEVKSPREGVVASVESVAGQAVSQGDVLLRFEAGSE